MPAHAPLATSLDSDLAINLRAAFSHASIADAAPLFLRALDAGLDWETATSAVAEGVQERFDALPGLTAPINPPAQRADRHQILRSVWQTLLLYVVVGPLLAVSHEVTVAGLALALHGFIATGPWESWIIVLRVDPIYAGAAVHSLASIVVQGLAIAPPLGDWLHGSVPAVFLPSGLVRAGAFASLVAAPGADLVAVAACSFGADVVWLAVGFALASNRKHARPVRMLGLFVQAEIVIGHLLQTRIGVHQLEASGVPFGMSAVAPGLGWWIIDVLRTLPVNAQAAIENACLFAAAYLVVLALTGAERTIRRHLQMRTLSVAAATPRLSRSSVAALILAVVVACSPATQFVRAASNWQPSTAADSDSLARFTRLDGLAEARADPALREHTVRIDQTSSGAWHYTVDDQPKVIRGIGYNPQYSRLPVAERVRLYERDFSSIRSTGANTIEGWFESEFDEVTLEAAARNGLGVFLPFELNQDWNYADPNVQEDLLQRIRDWVVRYRNAPALRMWAPGNEDLHRILYPRWISQEHDPVVRARAEAFAGFLARAVDEIHALDPAHPVLYRDAEDVYLPWLRRAFDTPDVSRPWFVYGANVYSEARLQDIVGRWPQQWIGGPLVISEFAPTGRDADARALGYAQDWQRIRARPDVVLGGLAYTWSTNGPEDLDRVFGLVDAAAAPLDGSLSRLAATYLNDRNASH